MKSTKSKPFTDFANRPNLAEIGADIKTCQANGKTIILSLGGGTYRDGGWDSESDAESAAQTVWDMFGPPGKQAERPFGEAVLDGFDFDFESTTKNLPAFAKRLRKLMDAATGGKKYYLSAAPQCVFPDANVGGALDVVWFDFILLQFYNNVCGVNSFQEGLETQDKFNFGAWDAWATKTSPNRNVKVLLGIPATEKAGNCYAHGLQLRAAFDWSKQYSSFGGAMIWDMSQLYSNKGFLDEVVSNLHGGPSTVSGHTGSQTALPSHETTMTAGKKSFSAVAFPTSSATMTGKKAASTPAMTSATIAVESLVPQWGQCGGRDYSGFTKCQPPYSCVSIGEWWWSCK